MSQRTVGFHLYNIYRKFKVSNRISAVRAAVTLGLLPGLGYEGLLAYGIKDADASHDFTGFVGEGDHA
jgi:hypothetical protein